MFNNILKNKVEEKNRTFIDEILQTTYASRVQIDLNIEKDIMEKRDEIEKQLNSVFGQVTYNWKMKVRNNALRGKYYANLFFFNNQQEADLFFIKNELYEKIGLNPPFLKLDTYFTNFGFDFKLLRKNGILLAQVSWEKYFEKEVEKINRIDETDDFMEIKEDVDE